MFSAEGKINLDSKKTSPYTPGRRGQGLNKDLIKSSYRENAANPEIML